MGRMKKMLLVIVMVSLGLLVNAQSSKRYYCELVGMYDNKSGYLNCTIVISINNLPFEDSWGDVKPNTDYCLVEKDGKTLTSMTGAANYMSLRGWQLKQVYSLSLVGSTHYVMYKDAPNGEKAMENLWIGGGDVRYGRYEKAIPLSEEIRFKDEDDTND